MLLGIIAHPICPLSKSPILPSLQNDPEGIIPSPITQDMSDTMRQIQVETIDRAAKSADGDIDKYAIALKNGMRLWLDKVSLTESRPLLHEVCVACGNNSLFCLTRKKVATTTYIIVMLSGMVLSKTCWSYVSTR